ncbi:Rha family transcriptional regulator [Starkeya nomas]|uniref:Rha family transcriptional regulator n=1 Tax=Starkeya nomas TaxID=2666134 RepID=UPI00135B3AA9|nr:Rha family transcriptional regulator [Starkeya nomas]
MRVSGHTVYASSRDVAAFFGKRHDNVLKAAEDAIAVMPAEGLPNFRETTYTHPQNGQTYRMYEMTKDGFTLLAMGFNGKPALASAFPSVCLLRPTCKKQCPNDHPR